MKSALLLLLFALPLVAQEPCNLTLPQAPLIRGMKLGMAEADVLKVLPSNPQALEISPKPGFEGIWSINPEYHKGRLSLLEIRYDRSIVWEDSAEFAIAITRALDLPAKAWRSESRSTAFLPCREFRLEIDSDHRMLKLIDLTAVSDAEKERLADEARKKRAFKP